MKGGHGCGRPMCVRRALMIMEDAMHYLISIYITKLLVAMAMRYLGLA